MSVSKESKVASYEVIKDRFSKAQSVVLFDYKGLTVAEVTALRKSCREAGADYKVFKNTLVTKALKELNIEGLDEHLEGTNAFVFGMDDVVAPAKIIFNFVKDNEKGAIKGGMMDNKAMSVSEIEALAKLPGKDALIVQVIWALQGNVRNLVYALNAIAEKQDA